MSMLDLFEKVKKVNVFEEKKIDEGTMFGTRFEEFNKDWARSLANLFRKPLPKSKSNIDRLREFFFDDDTWDEIDDMDEGEDIRYAALGFLRDFSKGNSKDVKTGEPFPIDIRTSIENIVKNL